MQELGKVAHQGIAVCNSVIVPALGYLNHLPVACRDTSIEDGHTDLGVHVKVIVFGLLLKAAQLRVPPELAVGADESAVAQGEETGQFVAQVERGFIAGHAVHRDEALSQPGEVAVDERRRKR